jgi:mono/diheme cytochrome c family protein
MRGLLALLLATTPTLAADHREAPKLVAPQQAGVGRLAPDLTAVAIDGRSVSLAALTKSSKAVVVAVTSTSCPLSRKSLPTLAALEADFAAKGVSFVYVNPFATDDADAVRKAVAAAGLKGAYLRDTAGFAAGLGATSTGDVFVLDGRRTVAYRGAVSDQYGLGYALPRAKHEYARDALTAVLAGKPVAVPATTAPGCELDASALAPLSLSPVTYHGRVSRIVQANCAECHRDGGVGPFPLDTLADLAAHRAMVRKVVNAGTMPPWHAAAAPGVFSNDRSLPPADKADLLAWLAAGLPAGDPADAPLPRAYPTGWAIGTPDLVVKLPKPVAIPATGTMPYQHVVVDPNLTEDRWIQAVEIRPSDPAVVHHVLVYPATGTGRADERAGHVAAYVPGNASQVYPDGLAKKLPKGTKLHFQIHYTPAGTATTDQLEFAVRFGPKPRHELRVAGLANSKFEIPPGDANYKNTAQITVPLNAVVLSFMPHMHLRGKACKYELVKPDGTATTILDVPHYDFDWQQEYRLADPLRVKRGETIRYTAWFDNSAGNPANPDPTAAVRWGPQTHDEMLLGYVNYYFAPLLGGD